MKFVSVIFVRIFINWNLNKNVVV